MSVDKTIKLTRSDDQSITVSSGTDNFTITFYEVPRVSDNAERRFHRIRKPLADVNVPYFPFTIYGSQTEGRTQDSIPKNKKKALKESGSGSQFLAIKDDKSFAIRMVGDCKESAFKVKVWIGGVNVLQHTTHGKKSQDYFVVSEQKWIWGKQVGKDTARQFRVFRRERGRLSLRFQLRKDNIKKEVEIEITSRRLGLPWPPPRMTMGDVDEFIPQFPQPPSPPPQPAYPACRTCAYAPSHAPCYPAVPAQQVAFQGRTSTYTGPSTPLPPPPSQLISHEIDWEDRTSEDVSMPPVMTAYQRQQSHAEVTEPDTCSSSDGRSSSSLPSRQTSQAPLANVEFVTKMFSYRSKSFSRYGGPVSGYLPQLSQHQAFHPRPPELFPNLTSSPPSPPSQEVEISEVLPAEAAAAAVEAASNPPSDQESIHSDPEEDMLQHQMVVGTGGLIEQIVHPDQHPDWIDDCTVSLKFKIVDPEYLQTEGGVKTLGTPGGNHGEVPNPPDGTFRGHAPVVTDPEELRRDIRSPMELETMDAGVKFLNMNGERGLPVDSGLGWVGDEENGDEEEDARKFQMLNKEAKSQPRGFMNDLRTKKESREQCKQGGARIQMIMKQEERKSKWRKLIDAMRRILTLGR
ncbi:hypothetical protein QBC32DRAFT_330513 [Pseudoneurospora amorphoporcata]|uniref:Uncharacterized protein n=1 Tax=Pseudoneurospora amorphoporcata TaxID=241081 RepID=A0AAN6P300_9PEZI|nr:hypothetical protein QBC32DRAFT_330513 [Pseudoneurospora amorphoporcata]